MHDAPELIEIGVSRSSEHQAVEPPAGRPRTLDPNSPSAAASARDGQGGIRQTRRRTPESQAQFRQELLAYAKDLYREKGYAALSIRSVTEALHISPMAFYGYFSSKQDLVKHIWVDFLQELLDRLVVAGQGESGPLQVIEAHLSTYLDYWEQYPDRYRMIYLTDLRELPGDEPGHFGQTQVAQRLMGLARERLLACCRGEPPTEEAIRLVLDRLFVLALGYLHTTLAIARYPMADRMRLKRQVVEDLMDLVRDAIE